MERSFTFVNESFLKYILTGQRRDEKTQPKSKLQNKRMSGMRPEIAYIARFASQNTVTVGWSFLEYIQSYSAGLQQFHNIDRWIWLELFSDDYDLGYPVPTLKR